MKIKLKKGDKCPICELSIKKPNAWVRFHIKYSPPIEILACKYCNYAEWAFRNKKIVGHKSVYHKKRVNRLIFFFNRFNIKL